MKNLVAHLRMIWLMKSPPVLFSRLFELPWYRGMLEQWAAPLQKNDASVLEVGCASGDFSRLLAQRNNRVVGVDRSARMLARAQKIASNGHGDYVNHDDNTRHVRFPHLNPLPEGEETNERLREFHVKVAFMQADAMKLPFLDQCFDIVLAASLLNVVDTPLAILKEMQRVCRKDGRVSVLVPDRAFSNVDAKRAAAQLTGFSRAAFLTWHRRGRKMDAETLRGYFYACGMTDVFSTRLLGGMVIAVSGEVSRFSLQSPI